MEFEEDSSRVFCVEVVWIVVEFFHSVSRAEPPEQPDWEYEGVAERGVFSRLCMPCMPVFSAEREDSVGYGLVSECGWGFDYDFEVDVFGVFVAGVEPCACADAVADWSGLRGWFLERVGVLGHDG